MSEKATRAMRDLIEAGIEEAKETDYKVMSRHDVAVRAGRTAGLISFYFGDMETFRHEVMRHAVERGIALIVARGILDGHPHAKNASAKLRKECAGLLK